MNIFQNVIYCDFKATFLASLLQSHDPSEIILIFWFAAQIFLFLLWWCWKQLNFWQILSVFSCVFTEERIESCHTVIKPRSVKCWSGVCPSVDVSHLHIWSWSSNTVTIRFLVTKLTKAHLHRLLSLARRPALEIVLAVLLTSGLGFCSDMHY